jgi:D-sedoheptulose 7-phosphate isomerase
VLSSSSEKFDAYASTVARNFTALAEIGADIDRACDIIISAMRAGGKAIFCGNGGSAADAQHLAAELMGRYLRDRPPLPSIALTVDTSALTAIANDYGYEYVFARQLRGIGRAGDVLIGISTSGNSRNVVLAMEAARSLGLATIALTGSTGGTLAAIGNLALCVPSNLTNHIQEMHIAIGHYMCGRVEAALSA